MVAKEGSAIEEYEPEALKKFSRRFTQQFAKKKGRITRLLALVQFFPLLNQYLTEKE